MTEKEYNKIDNNISEIQEIPKSMLSKKYLRPLYNDFIKYKQKYLEYLYYEEQQFSHINIFNYLKGFITLLGMFFTCYFLSHSLVGAIIFSLIGTILSFCADTQIGIRAYYNDYLPKKIADEDYHNYKIMLTNALNYVNNNGKIKEPLNIEINDRFLNEILDTISDIKKHSYKTCKNELKALQALSEKYQDFKELDKNNPSLTLDNKQEKLNLKLQAIRSKVKEEQEKYRSIYVIDTIDNLIKESPTINDKKSVNQEIYGIPKDIFLKGTSHNYLRFWDTYLDLKYPKYHTEEELKGILSKIKSHRLIYIMTSYIVKEREKYINPKIIRLPSLYPRFIISCILFTICFRIYPLSLIAASLISFGYPLIKENSYLNKKYISNLENKLEKFKKVAKKDSDITPDKEVDSFVKNIMSDIKLIENNPYKDCEYDIQVLRTLASDYATFVHNSSTYKPLLYLNKGTKDFYGRLYDIEENIYKNQSSNNEKLVINKKIKEALENPIVDNTIIENDIFIKDIIKVIKLIKTNNYANSAIELQEIRTIAIDYVNYAYCSSNKPSYEEFTKKVKEFYTRLLTVTDLVKNKQKVSDNVTEVDNLITKIGRIKLDTDLDLNINKLELKLK